MRLKGKTALISGASRNIGRAIALTFAHEGADVILVASKTGDDLKRVARECESFGVRALPGQADVSNHEEVNRVVKTGLERFGKVDVFVSVAGIRPHKPFWDISYEEWHKVMGVNLHSTFYFAKALASSMKERGTGGSIIALGGMASLTSQPNRAHVVASKTGLDGLIRALALELGPYRIRANLIAVGLIDTERHHNPEWYPEGGGMPHGMVSTASDGTPLGRTEGTAAGRHGTPQDVANAALFFASDESDYVTGDRMVCAGGRYM